MARYLFTLVIALLSLGGADALSNMVLPQETPVGLMAAMGMSPRPTNPPGVPEGIPRELARRQSSMLPYPPPGYYCGLVNSDPGLCSSLHCHIKISVYPVSLELLLIYERDAR